tara:strand:+ start:4855 stop:5196 length:342 start_codon:yes stop_codon:yes gene_type:complete
MWVISMLYKELVSEMETYDRFELELKHADNDKWLELGKDMVDSPAHYTVGSQEAIVTIEEAIASAPSVVAGMLQGQALKYLLRLWHKQNATQDARKALWYLKRLIEKLENEIR